MGYRLVPTDVGDVHNGHVVGIDVNGLVTNDQLFVTFLWISQHEQTTVTNIELILPFRQELVRVWILILHSNDEESKLFVELVCKDVKDAVFFIVDNLFHATDVVKLIEILFVFLGQIEVDTILWRGRDHNGLLIVHLEEFWLSIKRGFEAVDLRGPLCLEIEFDDASGLYEENLVGLSVFGVLEVELHTNLVKNGHIFDNNSLDLLKLGFGISVDGSLLLENKELIGLLLLHNQVFATDAGNKLVIVGFSDGDDLVWLSCRSFEQLDRKLTNLLEGVGVIEEYLVNLGNTKCIN